MGTQDTLEHQFWHCPFTAEVRNKDTVKRICSLDRTMWPQCLSLHGIPPAFLPPLINKDDVRNIQLLMGLTHHKRKLAMQQLRNNDPGTRFPWRTVELSVGPRPLTFTCTPATPHWWTGSTRVFLAIMHWLAQLTWKPGEVTDLELAVDFTLFSGTDPSGNIEPNFAPITACARAIRRAIARIAYHQHRETRTWSMVDTFPAARIKSASSLRGITGQKAIGYDRRPTFTSPWTARFLEEDLAKAATEPNWKDSLTMTLPDGHKPKYTPPPKTPAGSRILTTRRSHNSGQPPRRPPRGQTGNKIPRTRQAHPRQVERAHARTEHPLRQSTQHSAPNTPVARQPPRAHKKSTHRKAGPIS